MINLNKTPIDLSRFAVGLTTDELAAILRGLYWYEDKLTNMQRATGRDDSEWDMVVYLRGQLTELVTGDLKLKGAE